LAKQVQTLLVDDLDGSPADHADFPFALDGKQYEIDLSQANAIRLEEALDEFVTAARLVRRGSKPAVKAPARRPKEQTKAIRRWLRERGEQVSDRGRIPTHLVELFDKEAGRA
jgi:hypothetical protein